ncbi:MAG TPA: aldo/keto reductase [Gammaproteobacteria bacterium]|nr:aldo/keto reductase [Gammaproteobacteria bacterium]
MSIGMDAFRLPNGTPVSRLGQGAWQIGDDRSSRAAEHAALRAGLELGMNLIDTAEMYGNGRSEQLVADVITGQRDHVYLVSKVLPENATREGAVEACEESLKRLKTDYIDLYLLHWRGSVPFEETLEAFTLLRERGSIRHYGVSNFDVGDLEEASALEGSTDIATNQVLYNLEHRGVEWALLPWCRERTIPLMAYSPLGSDSRRLRTHPVLKAMAARLGASTSRIALAWLLRQPDVVVIPKASSEAHVRDNHAALELEISADELEKLDRSFPPPQRPTPLAMI